MARKALDIDNLGDLGNGTARLAVNKIIAAALADLSDRGADGKMREVNIKLLMCERQGEVVTEVDVSFKFPSLKTPITVAKMQQNGSAVQLLFQADDKDNPDQETFPFDQHHKEPGEI